MGLAVSSLVIGLIALVAVIAIAIWLFIDAGSVNGQIGVTGATATGNFTIDNLGNQEIVWTPSNNPTSQVSLTLSSNNNNKTGRRFFISNMNSNSGGFNNLDILAGTTTFRYAPAIPTKITVTPGQTASFIFTSLNVAMLQGVSAVYS